MLEQSEIIYKTLKMLENTGILHNIIIFGSWSIFFYKLHYKEAKILSAIRTTDIDIDVNFLRRKGNVEKVDITDALQPLGFQVKFIAEGVINLIHPLIKIEFFVPDKGAGLEACIKIANYGITAAPLRHLDLLEDEIITVDYKGLKVNVPHPARFALHKLIISQLRLLNNKMKYKKDITQGLEVLEMAVTMGEKQKIVDIYSRLTKKQKGLIKKAVGDRDVAERFGNLGLISD